MNNKQKVLIGVGVVVVALLCVGALVGGQSIAAAQSTAATTPLPPVEAGGDVIADGQVVPFQSAQLAFAVGGKVEKVGVEAGGRIEAGQLIARLAGYEQAQSAVAGAQMELLSAQQTLAALQRNAPVSSAQAELELANARKAEELAKEGKRDGSAAGLEDKLAKARAWLEDAQARYFYLMSKNDTSASGQFALQQAYQEYIHALQAVQDAQANYDSALNDGRGGGSLDSDISMAEYQMAVARRKAAEDAYNRLVNGLDPDQTSLAEARVTTAKAGLAAAEAGLRALEMHAPFAGTVVDLSLKEGEFVSPGVPVAVLANLNAWKVETTNLSEMDITKVQVGDSVTVTFDAIDNLSLTGKVSRISELGVNRQGEITYTVVIILDKVDPSLRWNMTAMVTIH